jgi:mRNA interferase HigB
LTVFGEAVLAKFARKHPLARKPLSRFLAIVRSAAWLHFPDLKQTFSSADFAPTAGVTIFDIGGNKYRVIAIVNFEKRIVFIQEALTHEEYNREKL